jgi:uncharacterized damage-inducible protein DinB
MGALDPEASVQPITRRAGALGALMDEYERAARELAQIVAPLTQASYLAPRDRETADEDCRSIHTVVNHVVRSGYRYLGYLRAALDLPFETPDFQVDTPLDGRHELETLALETAATFEGRWDMTDAQLEAPRIQSHWGPVYNLEQLAEHAIVHLLRHRRQIERFLTETRFMGERR